MRWGKRIFVLYWVVLLAELLLIYFQQHERFRFTKPLLMPLLMFAIFINRQDIPFYKLMLTALFFSWLGDVFLQFKNMFIPGLLAFFLVHSCYTIYFLKLQPGKKGLLQHEPMIGLPVAVYITLFLYFLNPFLDALKIPVVIYGFTIGIMMLAAIHTRRKLNDTAATLFFNGALQFIISDSLLAVNLFVMPSWVLNVCVMATYASAQYLLVRGSMNVQG